MLLESNVINRLARLTFSGMPILNKSKMFSKRWCRLVHAIVLGIWFKNLVPIQINS